MGGPPWPPLNEEALIEGGAATETAHTGTTDFSDKLH